MRNYSIDIAILYETWLVYNSCFSLNGYNFVGRNRARGVRIFLRKNIKFSIGNLNMKHGTLAISTKNLRHNIDIIVNYSFPNMDLAEFEAEMREIFRYTNTRKIQHYSAVIFSVGHQYLRS